MSVEIGSICSQDVCVCRLGAALAAAARQMIERHVGAIERMSERGVRRAPVVDDAGKLIGLVSFDDLLAHLTHNLSYLVELIGSQSHQELPMTSRTRFRVAQSTSRAGC